MRKMFKLGYDLGVIGAVLAFLTFLTVAFYVAVSFSRNNETKKLTT